VDDTSTLPPPFLDAVAALDAGDVGALERLLASRPELLRGRAEWGAGYFRRPYLLWFVAENPVRNGSLPANIVQVARAILRAAARERVETLKEQADEALALVGSGRVSRECGVQLDLIEALLEAGADPDGALPPALAHREVAAVERLLARGARLTLPAAAATGRIGEAARMGAAAGEDDRQVALAAAALHGRAEAVALLIDLGAAVGAYGPPGFHPHATPLHHAVDSGSLEAVRALVEAGADLGAKDKVYEGTPLDWADHLGRVEIAAYLRGKGGGGGAPDGSAGK
jgi:peptide-methionine (S)-S-oxide reductase